MRIISRAMLRDFWETPAFSDAEQALKAWYDEARHANWLTPQDIKDQFRSASFVGNDRVVFNIHGNKYRLVVAINYSFSVCYVRFVGTHKQYDKIDVATI